MLCRVNSPVSGPHRARPDLGQWGPRPLLSGFDNYMCVDGLDGAWGAIMCVCVCVANVRVDVCTWGARVPLGW